jgi:hypothetical protein
VGRRGRFQYKDNVLLFFCCGGRHAYVAPGETTFCIFLLKEIISVRKKKQRGEWEGSGREEIGEERRAEKEKKTLVP